jgi:hypothetical protein
MQLIVYGGKLLAAAGPVQGARSVACDLAGLLHHYQTIAASQGCLVDS